MIPLHWVSKHQDTVDFWHQMVKCHRRVEIRCGLSMDVSYDAVTQEPTRQSVDCNVCADALNANYTKKPQHQYNCKPHRKTERYTSPQHFLLYKSAKL